MSKTDARLQRTKTTDSDQKCKRCGLVLRGTRGHPTAEDCLEDLGPRYKLASSQLRVAETRARQALADADELRQKLATERAEGRAVANRLGFTARVATLESGQKQTDSMIERINQRLTFLLTEYSRMTEKKPVRRTEAA